MKFECDSCHAKYKISDDKVRGRVVRFPCRKCDHKILIDGRDRSADVTVPEGAALGVSATSPKPSSTTSSFEHEAATKRARRPSSPVRRRPSSVPPRRASAASRRLSSIPPAASSALVGQHPGLAPAVPAKPGAADAYAEPVWHVSINDVPVGPIRLEEMAHKIDAQAVSEYSLVWRDGFEEWRPLATVPELMNLLHERRLSGPPARPAFSSMPPFADSSPPASTPSAPKAPPVPSGLAATSTSGTFTRDTGSGEITVDFAATGDPLETDSGLPSALREMSQPPAPIGPDDVFTSSPHLGSFSGLPPTPEEPVSVPSAPPEPALAGLEPERRGISLGAVALIVAVAVFAGVLAFLAFERYGDSLLRSLLGHDASGEAVVVDPAVNTPTEAEAAQEVAPQAEEPSQVEEQSVEEQSAQAAEPEPQAPAAEAEAEVTAPARKPKPRAKPATPTTSAEDDSLSAEDEAMLEDFRSDADAAPAKIAVQQSGSTQSEKPPLDGNAVRAVVTANKPKLQRCYERAVRGQAAPPSVRMDVTVTVAPSGRVKDAEAVGAGPGGLAECIVASVRRWRFPASSAGGPAQFPIVFSGN